MACYLWAAQFPNQKGSRRCENPEVTIEYSSWRLMINIVLLYMEFYN